MKIASLVINTEQNWQNENLILPPNYVAFETDTNRFKTGDGKLKWNDLPYSIIPSDGNRATGTVIFYENPADGQTKDFNGTEVMFKDSPGAFPEVQRGLTLRESLTNAITALSAQTGGLATATYEQIADDKIKVTAVAVGEKGNTYSLSGGTASFSSPTTLENGEEQSRTPGIRLVASGTTDTISGADNGNVILYANDDPLVIEFASDIGVGFECWILRHISADLVTLDNSPCMSANGFYAVKAGGTVRIINPDASTNYLSGDLCQASTLFADLPGDPKVGDTAIISDSDTVTWGAVVAGGGSSTVIASYDADNTSWRVMGKCSS